MTRLIINPDTASAWDIPLTQGTLSLGRADSNDFVIAHSSVSASHCEVTFNGDVARIKDLGSSNGTFVEGELVEEALLKNGQTLRIGDVTVRFESDVVATKMPVARARVSASAGGHCKIHSRSAARFSCPNCHGLFCDLCVSVRRDKGRMAYFCRSCSVECNQVEEPQEVDEPEQSFARAAMGAFSYPIKGDGIFLLIVGGLFLSLLDGAQYLARFAFGSGLVAFLFLFVFGGGYLVSYLRKILTASALGENRVPDWPEVDDFLADIIIPFLQLLGTMAVCFAPALLMMIFGPADSEWLGWAIFAMVLLGCAYFPMAFTAVAMFDSVMALNPLVIIPSILRILGTYLFAVILFAAILFVRWLGDVLLPKLIQPRLLWWIASEFIGLYLLMLEVRILGLLYRAKKHELGWFSR